MAKRGTLARLAIVAILLASALTIHGQSLNFTNTPLLRPDGDSEPAISIGTTGTMAISGLSWSEFVTNYWSGAFGSTPTYIGAIDAGLQQPGRRVFGGGDADVDLGTTGTLHASTLIFLVNKPFTGFQLGVSAISCPDPGTLANCTRQIIDTAGDDRQWITSDAARVYISYHDAGNSSLIRVQRSDDDGLTWKKVGDPIVGQDGATGNATFNNTQGPIVADTLTHNVYDIYAAGEAGIQKGTSASFNNIYVSKSTDGGKTWTASLVFHAPLFTALNNVFPSLAVDPANGTLYATWTDTHGVYVSSSTDQAVTWSAPVRVSSQSLTTTVMPWVAARDGIVDVVFYGTTAASNLTSTAVWNVYLSQSVANGAFSQSKVSRTPNHVGVVCLGGTSCGAGTRNLLDLFEVAIDPGSGKAAVIYTDDTITKTSAGAPLPQVVLATQQ
jgi:hypothetical protein